MSDYPNPWLYRGVEFNTEDILTYQGFVYIIENLATGRKYIGKKNFWTPKTTYKVDPKTKKRKKIRSRNESDWKSYYGSNKELQEHVAADETKAFKREILHLCTTKSDMSYFELREQMDQRVLESPLFYNSWIMVRVRKDHLKNL